MQIFMVDMLLFVAMPLFTDLTCINVVGYLAGPSSLLATGWKRIAHDYVIFL